MVENGKLSKLEIGKYGFDTKEEAVIELIKYHINKVDDPIKEIQKALDSEAGLAELIEEAKSTYDYGNQGSAEVQAMINIFLTLLDGYKFSSLNWNAMKPFLQDCLKELEKCERAELLS